MIITQTPLRISFFGGGTDFSKFYRQEEGCVLSSAIDKYIFVIVKDRFDKMIRVGYTQTELVDSVDQLEHELVREALKVTGVDSQIEINTLGDIPSSGSGLGSSSTVTVGVLNALFHHLNNPRPLDELASLACQVEIERLKKPIGKQDQYIAAFGGLRLIRFLTDGRVEMEQINLLESERRRLNCHLMLFYTNRSRQANDILAEQNANVDNQMNALRELKEMARQGKTFLETGDFDAFGYLMDRAWQIKKSLASKISDDTIDEIYAKARRAGALGGKITGAGGGGFLLLYCSLEKQDNIRTALNRLQELPFRFEREGSKVIFNYPR